MSQYERLCDNVLHKKIGAANTYIFKIVVCIIIAVIVNEASFAMDFKFRLFFERDTDLSYYIKGKPNYDTVSVGEVIGLSAGIGLAFVAISTAMLNIRPSTGKTEDTGISRLQHFLLYALALIFALLAENTAVSIMKVACARPRPSAFYICNYKGYRDAVDSGDFTDYDNATVIGAAADAKYCLEKQGTFNDAFMSFPSGHSSLIAASMLFCCLLFRKTFHITSSFSEVGILSWCPLVIAGYVSITRVQDFKHREDDVGFGAVVGFIVTGIVWHTMEHIMDQLTVAQSLASKDSKDGTNDV